MTRSLPIALLATLAALAVGTPAAQAASFIKFDGVEGRSEATKGHKGEIELLSWSYGPATTNGGGAGKASLVVTLENASPELQRTLAEGNRLDRVAIRSGNGASYTTYELKDVLITGYQTSGHGLPAPSGTGKTLTAVLLGR